MRRSGKTAVSVLLVIALMAAMMLVSCSGSSEEKKKEEKPAVSVSGKCYVLAGMSSDEEEFDEDLLKDMLSVQEISEYLSVYFAEDGKAYVQSMLYGADVVEGTWKEDGSGVIVDLDGDLDDMSFEIQEDGTAVTLLEEDEDEFMLTLQPTEDFPAKLAEKK